MDDIELTKAAIVESEDPREGSLVRWQGISLEQMGYAVNLILAFATASLGFSLSLIKDKDFTPGCWGKAFMVFSVCLLILSVVLGTWCVVNRLLSFRHTKNAARTREKLDKLRKRPAGHSDLGSPDVPPVQETGLGLLEKKLEMERTRYRTLDKRTWLLFWFQIATFGFGILFLVASFAAVYAAKLF